MKISGTGIPAGPDAGKAIEAARSEDAAPAAASPQVQAPAAKLQSAVLQPALAALQSMSDVDQAKVESLRDALARGELPFNPVRLAALIERYHGPRE